LLVVGCWQQDQEHGIGLFVLLLLLNGPLLPPATNNQQPTTKN
jgi:hypothetical protein